MTFQFLMVVVDGSVMEAFKVSPRDRVQQRFEEQIPLTLQFLRVVAALEVLKASSRDLLVLHPRTQDELETGLESESEPEEDPWSSTWVGPCGCVSVVTGAPSHTHGLSFTRKLQPMSTISPRTHPSEAVVAASGPGREEEWRGRRSRFCRSSSTPRR